MACPPGLHQAPIIDSCDKICQQFPVCKTFKDCSAVSGASCRLLVHPEGEKTLGCVVVADKPAEPCLRRPTTVSPPTPVPTRFQIPMPEHGIKGSKGATGIAVDEKEKQTEKEPVSKTSEKSEPANPLSVKVLALMSAGAIVAVVLFFIYRATKLQTALVSSSPVVSEVEF